jgi:outer membrane protein assembly factor BamB
LFIILALSPIVLGNNIRIFNINNIVEKSEIDSFNVQQLDGPPMNYPWPMYCHDARHTGRSPYSTADNPGLEKWNYKIADSSYQSSPVIDNEGVIYIGRGNLYAIYPNGTLKWMYDLPYSSYSTPAIDENGIIYIGTRYDYPKNHLYAINTSSGKLEWKFEAEDIIASPVIGEDGTIYFCDGDNWRIKALFPNGSLKWSYKTGHVIYSSPAIGLDSTIYCGSFDNYVYALYSNNGTLKWKYKTGDWVHGSPTVADDGTVYIGSDDKYLYAIKPDGTLKWRCSIGHVWGSPAIDENGIIYVGTWEMKFFALNPNGTKKWKFEAPGRIWFGNSPAISDDGIIYFGTTTQDGGKGRFIALNSDGTEHWNISYGLIESSPAIGIDGTIYICSSHLDYGYLHAINELDPNSPSSPEIDGPNSGRTETEYDYTLKSTSPIGNDVYYWIEWGDGDKTEWIGPFSSGEEITVSHTWSEDGTYTIKARAKDTDNLWGPWSEFEVTIPRTRASSYQWYEWLLERFPLLERLLGLIK